MTSVFSTASCRVGVTSFLTQQLAKNVSLAGQPGDEWPRNDISERGGPPHLPLKLGARHASQDFSGLQQELLAALLQNRSGVRRRLQDECHAAHCEVAPGRQEDDVSQLLLRSQLMERRLLRGLDEELTQDVVGEVVWADLQGRERKA